MLSTVSVEQSKDRTDRAVVTPWLKFLWEAYRTVLDILRNNARLETLYQQTCHQAFQFCLKYSRKTEFRRLCDLLRNHLQNIAKYAHQPHTINLNDPDTLQRHLDTRFAQLNAAVELELWQEAFRSVEDIHNLLTMSKKMPRPVMMANYYEKLTKIFMVSDNYLFHAAAWNKYYTLVRAQNKNLTEEDNTRYASFVLLSALAIPVIATSRSRTGMIEVDESKPKSNRLASLLGLNRPPTRAGILKEALNKNILRRVRPELRELYNILEVEFHPLSICKKIHPIIALLSKDQELVKYIRPLHQVVLTRLLQQLSQVYDSIKLEFVMKLASFAPPHAYDAAAVEKFIMNGCKKGELSIRVDHATQSLFFEGDLFASPKASITEAIKLQSTPSDLMRSQLSRLAKCFHTAVNVIDKDVIDARKAAKKEAFARSLSGLPEEHKAVLARKAIIDRRKELAETLAVRKEKEEARERALRLQADQEAEQRRLAEEAKKRELERIKKEHETIRLEEAKKLAESLKAKSGLKVDLDDLESLDKDKLVQLQVEQLEKEKRDLSERLRVIAKRMDHLERAYRIEEIPLLEQDYDRQKHEDREYYDSTRKARLDTAKSRHREDIILKKRLGRILPDYDAYRKVQESKRAQEFQAKREAATAKIEEEKEKRRQLYIRKKEEERQRMEAEEAEERRKEEEAAKEAEEKEQREREFRAKMEEEKRIRDEERAKLDAAAQIQRDREAEAERKIEEKKRLGSSRTATPDEGVWRRAGPPAVANAASREGRYTPPASRNGPSANGPSSGGAYRPPGARGDRPSVRSDPFGGAKPRSSSGIEPDQSRPSSDRRIVSERAPPGDDWRSGGPRAGGAEGGMRREGSGRGELRSQPRIGSGRWSSAREGGGSSGDASPADGSRSNTPRQQDDGFTTVGGRGAPPRRQMANSGSGSGGGNWR